MDFVLMHHPDVEGFAEATRDAFEQVWKDKGWVLIEPKADTSSLKKEELISLAESRGLSLPAKATKDEIVAALVEGEG